jgi:ADP-heptose:LPS heptosyltransferase
MKNVYTAESIHEIQNIIRETQPKSSLLLKIRYFFIRSKIIFLNIILSILELFLFKKGVPKQDEIKTIVVYSVGILGDNAVRLPAILTLKKAYPASKIIVINKYQKWNPKVPQQLFESVSYIDRVILVRDNPVQKKGLSFTYDDKQTKDLECDLFINLSPLGPRGWLGAVVREIVLAKKLKAKYALGFRMYSLIGLENIQNIKHIISNFNYPRLPEQILKKLHLSIDYTDQVFSKNDEASKSVDLKLREIGVLDKYAILHPGGTLVCQRWPASRYAEIAMFLDEQYGLKSIITGVESESEIANEVVERSKGSAFSLAGKTSLLETIALIQKAQITISNDTGMLHLSSVQNIPTIGIFGSRDTPLWWFPIGEKKSVTIGFSKDSYRYLDGNIITDLLSIETADLKHLINKMHADHIIKQPYRE